MEKERGILKKNKIFFEKNNGFLYVGMIVKNYKI